MIKKKSLYAVLATLILLSLLIPWSKAGSAPLATPQPETSAEDEEPALNTPPATTTISLAEAVTQTIAIKETGGTLDCSKKGLSGERGCHQFMPSTWRGYATEVYGYIPEQTPEAAEYVTLTKVQRWLDAGYTPRQIFLIWNQGHAGQCKAGVNRHGVPFDSCAYVAEALSILAEVIPSS